MNKYSANHLRIKQAIQSSPEKVQARAKKLYQDNHVHFLERTTDQITEYYIVESQYSYDKYEVVISLDDELKCHCTCPYDQSLYCKHILAVLHSMLQKAGHNENIAKKPRKMDIKLKTFIDLLKKDDYDNIKKRNQSFDTTIEDFNDGLVSLNVENAHQQHHVSFKSQKEQNRIALHCDCSFRSVFQIDFCEHLIAALKQLKEQYGDFFLHESFDWTTEKEELLAKAGFTFDDDYEEFISFEYDDERMGLMASRKSNILIDKEIHSISSSLAPEKLLPDVDEKNSEEYGIVLQNTRDERLIELNLIKGPMMKNNIQFRKISDSLTESHPAHFFNKAGYEPYQELHQWYTLNMDPENFVSNIPHAIKDSYRFYSRDDDEITHIYYNILLNNMEETRAFAYQYIPAINEFVKRSDNLRFYKSQRLHIYEQLKAKHLKPLSISQHPVKCQLNISVGNISYEITGTFYHAGKEIVLDSNFMHSPWLIGIGNNEVAPWENPGTFICALLHHFNNPGKIFISKHKTNDLMAFIQSLQNEIEINMPELKPNQIKKQKPNFKISLSEIGNSLLFYLIAQYGEEEIVVNPKSQHHFSYDQQNEKFNQTERDQEAEASFLNFFLDLHPKFTAFNQQDFFYLQADEVMKDFWFMDFFEKCLEQNIEIYGFEHIKSIKYNPNKPTTNYNIKSETDWFDIEMDVWFGKEKVSLSEIRKSVLKKENTVKLSDGSTGILPGEWIREWYAMLRFGEIKKNNIKISNMHFLFVDQLFNKLDHQEKIKELEDKKKKLNNFKNIKQIEAPAGLNATLRDYQKTGLSWLHFLYEYQFGGILADDMGLGKTIQVIALLLYIKNNDKRKKRTNLVVAPTTLIFNWQKEIEKFAPELSFLIHWGAKRDSDTKSWKQKDIILTTYGTLSNDIDMIRKFQFEVSILDESQAIKNPSSLRFKASCLIKSHCRLALTGTPIENNTMELYAQMQYLNPGYLGSLNRFKKEFSQSIDQNKDQETTQLLNKMIRPFILRRKKEQVAKELPDKTEMVMYCEMSEDQQKVYDYYKDDIRKRLLQQVDEEGVNQAKFNVLEGLMKLRQICDSPAILNTKEELLDASIKRDELIRHIKEKTGKHKILVFSQFVSMLTLIRKQLDEEGIDYTYLDGKTKDRAACVNKFQDDNQCRVFLLSIKAGGYGLNLTEADYVYILDPWWNPAIENQAIDRAYRIGQEKHVFAYKMICKNSIEEKILQLQEKKKAISDEIISNEQGFVSQLNRDDLAFLLR